jgi:disulfide bond formation protein DsbB
MFIFWVCVIAMGLLLFTLKEGELHREVRDLGRLGRATLRILLVVLVANVVQAFISVGPPPFVGPANPVRFSWNPRNWSWGLEEWGGRGPSLRGQWAIPKPDLANLNQDPAAGPFVGLPSLTVSTWLKLPSGIRNPSGLAWDEASQRFAVVTEGHCVYLLDAGLTGIQRWTCVDPTYDIDLGHGFVGVAFYGGGLMAIAENKSWTFLKEAPPDAKENWHSFLTNRAAFEEISRGEFTSVRARRSYISALAAGPSGLYLVPLPNNHQKNFVVSRFDPKDLMLAEEFVLTASDLSFVRGRSLSDLAPVGLAVEGDRLLALSGSFSTLLEIDLKTHQVSRAWELQGLTRPTGLALRGTDLLVLCADGRVAVLPRP